MALRFDASTDMIGSTTGFVAGSRSYTFWFKVTTPRATTTVIRFANASLSVKLYSDATGLSFFLDTSGGGNSEAFTVTQNVWHRVVIVHDGTTLRMRHGAVTAPTLSAEITLGYAAFTPTLFNIGNTVATSTVEFLNGVVANFKEYQNYALTADEAENELQQYQPSRTDLLSRWYPCVNTVVAACLIDGSGSARNLTAGSTATAIEDGPPIRWGRARGPRVKLSPASAPVVDAGVDATTVAGTQFNRTASEMGSGITARSWTILAGPTGKGSTIGSAAALSWTPSTAAFGTYILRYAATNPTGTGINDVMVTVNPVAPSVNAGVDSTINEGNIFNRIASESYTEPTAVSTIRQAVLDRALRPADILMIGDSITEGAGASTRANRYIEKMQSILRGDYPTAGVAGGEGYVSSMNISTSFVTGWSYAGNIAGDGTFGFGHRTAVIKNPDGALSRSVSGTSIEIAFSRATSTGSFGVYLDGSATAALIVDTAVGGTSTAQDDGRASLSLGTRGVHTVQLKWVSGGDCYIGGLWVYDQDEITGIRVTESGQEGSNSGQWSTAVNSNAYTLSNNMAELAPDLVIIELGANDMIQGLSSASYKTNIQTLIAQVRGALNPDPTIMLVAAYQLQADYTEPWSNYVAKLSEIVVSDPTIAFLDLSAIMPRAGATSDLIFSDGVHPSDVGHDFIARTIADTVSKTTVASRAWTIQSGPIAVGAVVGKTRSLSWAPPEPGTYVLNYAAANQTGTGSDQVQLTVTATPVPPPAVSAGVDSTVTIGQSFARLAVEGV